MSVISVLSTKLTILRGPKGPDLELRVTPRAAKGKKPVMRWAHHPLWDDDMCIWLELQSCCICAGI